MHEFYEYTKTSIDLFSNEVLPRPISVPEPPYLLRLRTDLEGFAQELIRLIGSCSKIDVSDGQSKISRLKWLRRKKEIVGLSTRCHDLRCHLERAITPLLLQVQRYVLRNVKIERLIYSKLIGIMESSFMSCMLMS